MGEHADRAEVARLDRRRRCAGRTGPRSRSQSRRPSACRPWPPSASGIVMPSRPCVAMSFATSHGYSRACARSRAPCARCFSAMPPHRFAKLLLLGGEAEVHGVLQTVASCRIPIPLHRIGLQPSARAAFQSCVVILEHNEPVDRDHPVRFDNERIDLRFRHGLTRPRARAGTTPPRRLARAATSPRGRLR